MSVDIFKSESVSHLQLFATPWTVARQVPLSMEFSSQEYWSGLPCPPQGIFPTRWTLHHLSHQGSPSVDSTYI